MESSQTSHDGYDTGTYVQSRAVISTSHVTLGLKGSMESAIGNSSEYIRARFGGVLRRHESFIYVAASLSWLYVVSTDYSAVSARLSVGMQRRNGGVRESVTF
jgi:hypothetical protein